jgi:hypothetical protein
MKKALTSLTFLCLLAAYPGFVEVRAQSAAQDYLNRAADAVLALKSAQFTLRREGAPAVLDERSGLTFTAADCSYAAPDRVSCDVRVSLKSGSVLQITRVWVPEGVFQNNPLTKQFARLPADASFNGVVLFARTGVPQILRTGVLKPQLINKAERLGSRDTVHVRGEVAGSRLNPLMGGTLQPEASYPVDLWMDERSGHIVQMHVSESGGSGWLIELFAINEPVSIPTPQVPASPSPAAPGP